MPQMKPLFSALLFSMSRLVFFLMITLLNSTVFPVNSASSRKWSKVVSWLKKMMICEK